MTEQEPRYCTYCDKEVYPLMGARCPDCGNRTRETQPMIWTDEALTYQPEDEL